MTIEAGWEELQKDKLNPQWGQQAKTYSEEEYKNAQAFWTKAQQEKIAMAEKLVGLDPKQLESINDVALQNKVISNLYGASNIEELKILNPELFTDAQGEEEGEESEVSILQKKVRIMEYKANQWALDNALDAIVNANKDLADTIPNFKEKMLEEIKYISSDMSIQDRVARWFKLVAWTSSWQNAYLALQWQSVVKTVVQEEKPAGKDLKSQLKELIF